MLSPHAFQDSSIKNCGDTVNATVACRDRFVEWRCGLTSPIHLLLRKVRGVWPPPESPHPQTKKLEGQLKKDGFVPATVSRHLFRARHFLGYLGSRGIAVEQVKPCDIRAYRSKQLTTYRKRYGRGPLNERQWG